jgi:Biotin-requiring enzyme
MPLQGNIAEWKVEEGQEIAAGDVLAEIETDKATMDWESQVQPPACWALKRMCLADGLPHAKCFSDDEGAAMPGLQDDGYIAKILMPAGSKDIKVNTVVRRRMMCVLSTILLMHPNAHRNSIDTVATPSALIWRNTYLATICCAAGGCICGIPTEHGLFDN